MRELEDPFARNGLLILRGTGLRISELLDLELDCLWDVPSHGTWVKVPLGKLHNERMVPLDEETLASFDALMAARGSQRARPHQRDGRMADFISMCQGQKMTAYRLRQGLRDAVEIAGMKGRAGSRRRSRHQFRHTYGTQLISSGVVELEFRTRSSGSDRKYSRPGSPTATAPVTLQQKPARTRTSASSATTTYQLRSFFRSLKVN